MGRRASALVDYERVAALYEKGRALPAEVVALWEGAVRRYVRPDSGRVVDLGAGTGIFARAWREWTPAPVLAVEPSAAMIEVGARTDPTVRYVRGVAEALPLRAASTGVVWVSTALHHFADVDRALDEIARVLDPAGRVLVRNFVPGRTEITWTEELPARDRWHARFPTEPQLVDLFTRHGFAPVDACEVLEWTETFAESARWVERMRHADSLLTALTDEEIAAGLEALRSRPSTVGRMETTLFVFDRNG